jgi:hypothetical protein
MLSDDGTLTRRAARQKIFIDLLPADCNDGSSSDDGHVKTIEDELDWRGEGVPVRTAASDRHHQRRGDNGLQLIQDLPRHGSDNSVRHLLMG